MDDEIDDLFKLEKIENRQREFLKSRLKYNAKKSKSCNKTVFENSNN
jgi:hypothetical protein